MKKRFNLEDMIIEDVESECFFFEMLYKIILGTKRFNERFGMADEEDKLAKFKVGDKVKINYKKCPEPSKRYEGEVFTVMSEPYRTGYSKDEMVDIGGWMSCEVSFLEKVQE